MERRVAEAMRGGRMAANGGKGGGYAAPSSGNGMVSGVGSLGDYDIPTFFKNAD